jgi:hypothetical protein
MEGVVISIAERAASDSLSNFFILRLGAARETYEEFKVK